MRYSSGTASLVNFQLFIIAEKSGYKWCVCLEDDLLCRPQYVGRRENLAESNNFSKTHIYVKIDFSISNTFFLYQQCWFQINIAQLVMCPYFPFSLFIFHDNADTKGKPTGSFRRPGRSQGLLYKHCCQSYFVNPCLYGAATPKLLYIALPVIKQTVLHRKRTFKILQDNQIAQLFQNLQQFY